jgi:hypothetical protein
MLLKALQVDVCQQQTDCLPLARTCFAHEKPAIFNDAYLYPLPYRSKRASIADSFLEHFHELRPHDRIKICSNV